MNLSRSLRTFFQHDQHAALREAVQSCPPGSFVYLEGPRFAGKTRSLQELSRTANSIVIPLGPWIENPETIAMTVVDGFIGAWPDPIGLEENTACAVDMIRSRHPDFVAIDAMEYLEGMPHHIAVLRKIVAASETPFILSGRNQGTLSSVRILCNDPPLTRMRHSTVNFQGLDANSLNFQNVLRQMFDSLAIPCAQPYWKHPRHLAALEILTGGRVGEVAHFRTILVELMLAKPRWPTVITEDLLSAVADIMIEREVASAENYGTQNPYTGKTVQSAR